jgi:hypothetical protein
MICDHQVPPWRSTHSGHAIRCHIPLAELVAENLIGEDGDSSEPKEQHPSVSEVTI